MGNATALTDGANLYNVQVGSTTYLSGVAGTNTITATATPTPAYVVGQRFTFVPANTNTGATTLNISSVGAGAVQWAGAALTGGELVAGTPVTVLVTATTPVFEIINATQFPDTRALVVGGTDATKKLRFEVDGIATGTTRVITMPDKDVTLADATTTAGGLIELAIQSEVDAGTDSTRAITPSLNRITLATQQATTSGTAFDFTGIPAGTRLIRILLNGVSLSGTDNLLVQIGDSGGIENTAYISSSSTGGATVDSTAGFIITAGNAAATVSGVLTLCLIDSATFTWIGAGAAKISTATAIMFGGNKALSAELTQIRLTRTGTDTFDAGAVSIQYER